MSESNYLSKSHSCTVIKPGAIIGDGDRKSWDPRRPMILDNFSIFRTNCAILTSYIHARVVVSRVDVVTLRDQLLRIARFSCGFFTAMAGNKEPELFYLTIRLRARVFYEQIVNEAQPS